MPRRGSLQALPSTCRGTSAPLGQPGACLVPLVSGNREEDAGVRACRSWHAARPFSHPRVVEFRLHAVASSTEEIGDPRRDQRLKSVLKRMIPGSIAQASVRLRSRLGRRRRPRFTSARGASADVLQCCIAYNPLGGYCVPLSSRQRPAAQAILDGEIWERATLEILGSAPARGDIVHAGTFFGDFLPALSRSRSGDDVLWAFEPNP